jgi:hypothetical protein
MIPHRPFRLRAWFAHTTLLVHTAFCPRTASRSRSRTSLSLTHLCPSLVYRAAHSHASASCLRSRTLPLSLAHTLPLAQPAFARTLGAHRAIIHALHVSLTSLPLAHLCMHYLGFADCARRVHILLLVHAPSPLAHTPLPLAHALTANQRMQCAPLTSLARATCLHAVPFLSFCLSCSHSMLLLSA